MFKRVMTIGEMIESKKLIIAWCTAHNFPCKITEDKKVIWQTNFQTGEYNSETDSITWHNREYFFEK